MSFIEPHGSSREKQDSWTMGEVGSAGEEEVLVS